MYQTVVGGSIVPDRGREVIAEFIKQEEAVVGITKDTTKGVTEEYEKMSKGVTQSTSDMANSSDDFVTKFNNDFDRNLLFTK